MFYKGQALMTPAGKHRIATIKAVVLILFVITAVVVVRLTPVRDYLTSEKLAILLETAGLWAPLAYVLFVTAGVCLFVPGTLLVALGAVIFGAFFGFLYGWIGAMLGASVAFLVSRYLGREFTASLVGEKLRRYDDQIEKHGFATVLYLRLMCCPFSPLSFGMGLTKVRFWDYFLGTALGIIIALFIISFFVGAVREVWASGRWGELLNWKAFLVVVVFVLSFFIPRFIERFRTSMKIQTP